MIWQHEEAELITFVEHLNTRVPTITYTQEHSAQHVSFLDVLVRIINNHLETDLFSKTKIHLITCCTAQHTHKDVRIASRTASSSDLEGCARG